MQSTQEKGRVVRKTVKAVRKKSQVPKQVYNVRVKDNHNYFVDGLLTHNCDDPIKNMEEALSPVHRTKLWDWYASTFLTRMEGDGGILVIQTRWHEDDLAGKLLEKMEKDSGADQWTILNLPAIKEDTHNPLDPRETGEALWPAKYDIKILNKFKSTVTTKVWDSLYQQKPSPDGGEIINRTWWKFYKQLPELNYVMSSWDMTFKGSKKSDFVVGQVWGVSGVNKYLLKQIRKRMTFTEALYYLQLIATEYPNAIKHVVEDKANGPAIIDTLKSTVPGLVAFSPKESKEARANAIAPQIEAGNVWLPDPEFNPDNKWVYEYIEEWAHFPNGKNDDQVDGTTQALLDISGNRSWLDELILLDPHVEKNKEMMKKFWPGYRG